MSTKHERMYAAIQRHGLHLITALGLSPSDPVKLCKQLRRIESKLNRTAVDCCNGDVTTPQWEAAVEDAKRSLARVIGKGNVPKVHFNPDGRGYALKLTEETGNAAMAATNNCIYRDWGGYVILAPDFGLA